MSNKLKIAIYSGDIPSTTFIERLVFGLSRTYEIYLFGFIKQKKNYSKSIHVVGYKNTRIRKFLHLCKYTTLLLLFRYSEKKKLDGILKSRSKNILLAKVKAYPVLWHKPDIFHVQWAKGLADWIWVKQFGMKLVLSLRGAHINYSPIANKELALIYKENFPKVDAFHAVSKAISKEAQQYFAPKDKIKVVYSGLDNNLIGYSNFLEQQEKEFLIISIGRPHWIKGYVHALDACKILKDKGVKFKYKIIGVPNDIELKYHVKDLGLENNVVLLDKLPFEQVVKYYQKANLLLLPSLKEGIANVVLEAMAMGTIVLTTNCGGITEVVNDGKNGFVVPVRDSNAIADKIIEIKDKPDQEIEEIKKNAQETILDQHQNEHMISGMLKLYESL